MGHASDFQNKSPQHFQNKSPYIEKNDLENPQKWNLFNILTPKNKAK